METVNFVDDNMNNDKLECSNELDDNTSSTTRGKSKLTRRAKWWRKFTYIVLYGLLFSACFLAVTGLVFWIIPNGPNTSKRILLLVDISKVDLSYTVPVGALSHTIKQGSTFYYSGLVLYSEDETTTGKNSNNDNFCIDGLIQVNKTSKSYYFDKHKNNDSKSSLGEGGLGSLRVVGEFSTKMEVLKPTPNNTEALKWFGMLFGDCNPAQSREAMVAHIKNHPYSKGISMATYTTHISLYGKGARADSTMMILDFTYRMLEPYDYNSTETTTLMVPYSMITNNGKTTKVGTVKFELLGHAVQPVKGETNTLEGIGSVHMLVFGEHDSVSTLDLYSPSNDILSKMFG